MHLVSKCEAEEVFGNNESVVLLSVTCLAFIGEKKESSTGISSLTELLLLTGISWVPSSPPHPQGPHPYSRCKAHRPLKDSWQWDPSLSTGADDLSILKEPCRTLLRTPETLALLWWQCSPRTCPPSLPRPLNSLRGRNTLVGQPQKRASLWRVDNWCHGAGEKGSEKGERHYAAGHIHKGLPGTQNQQTFF